MVIDCGQVLKNLDGAGLVETDTEGKEVPFTLGRALANALLVPNKVDKGADKIKKYDLALRAHKGGQVPFEKEEVDMIRGLVEESYAPLIVGQIVSC